MKHTTHTHTYCAHTVTIIFFALSWFTRVSSTAAAAENIMFCLIILANLLHCYIVRPPLCLCMPYHACNLPIPNAFILAKMSFLQVCHYIIKITFCSCMLVLQLQIHGAFATQSRKYTGQYLTIMFKELWSSQKKK